MTLISSLLNWESAEHALIEALAQHPEKESLQVLVAGTDGSCCCFHVARMNWQDRRVGR